MKLKKSIIENLRTNRALRLKLCLALGFGPLWMDKMIRVNKDNGYLTTAKAIQVIGNELGIPGSEIIEEVLELS